MGNKFFIGIVFLALGVFAYLSEAPSLKRDRDNALLFSNPLILKALSGYSNGLIADKLWLLSSSVSETGRRGSDNVDTQIFYHTMLNITTLDPYFSSAIVYGATFLASIQEESDLALDLLAKARYFDSENFQLYMLAVMIELTYKKPSDIDYKEVIRLSEFAASLPDGKKVFGQIKVKDWLKDVVAFSKNQQAKHQKIIDDTKWLYEHTQDLEKKEQIKKRLDQLLKKNNSTL